MEVEREGDPNERLIKGLKSHAAAILVIEWSEGRGYVLGNSQQNPYIKLSYSMGLLASVKTMFLHFKNLEKQM